MSIGLLTIFVASILVAIVVRSRAKVGDALTAAIIFVPALLYWLDGKPISEISGGTSGITVKMDLTSSLPVSEIDLGLDSVAVRHDPETAVDNQWAAYWESCGDYIMVRSADGPTDTTERDQYLVTLAAAIRASVLCGRLIGVVVVDERERYIGSFDKSFYAELAALWVVSGAEQRPSAKELFSLYNSFTIFGASLANPERRLQSDEGFVAAINRDAPLSSALQLLAEKNVPFLALTDEQGVLTGILPRSRVVDVILQALISKPAKRT